METSDTKKKEKPDDVTKIEYTTDGRKITYIDGKPKQGYTLGQGGMSPLPDDAVEGKDFRWKEIGAERRKEEMEKAKKKEEEEKKKKEEKKIEEKKIEEKKIEEKKIEEEKKIIEEKNRMEEEKDTDPYEWYIKKTLRRDI
jgi:flagellar biosynthesis GTPase FlhF